MELLAAYIIGAAILVAPFAIWVYTRKDRWRRPKRAVGLAYLVMVVLEMLVVGTSGILYPFGFPGPEERAWRAAAVECGTRYAAAHTNVDTDVVDSYVHRDDTVRVVPPCHTFRVERLTSATRQCRPGSRCARMRHALRLP